MIIRKYGIELHRLTIDDIELVRSMRNSADIRSFMFSQEHITKEKQENWFHSINNHNNYFFLVHHQEKKIGLIQGKNCDFTKRDVEGGIYIWEKTLRNSGVAAKASIAFMEATFNIILMSNVYSQVRPDNSRALGYNKALGYVPDPSKGEHFMIMDKATYLKKIPRLRFLASGSTHEPPLSTQDIEIRNPQADYHLYKDLPDDVLNVLSPLLSPRN